MSYHVMSWHVTCHITYHISCMYICTWYDTCLKKKSVEKDLLLLHWFQIWDMPIMLWLSCHMTCTSQIICHSWHIVSHVIYIIFIYVMQHKCSLLIENWFSTRYNIQHVTWHYVWLMTWHLMWHDMNFHLTCMWRDMTRHVVFDMISNMTWLVTYNVLLHVMYSCHMSFIHVKCHVCMSHSIS